MGNKDFKPKQFGKYLLIERVSVGGMAEVFKSMVIGLSGFQKILAIKRILPNIAEEEDFIPMFVDEANIAGLLHHANIAQIYDLGQINDSYYIAMEYVEGKDLRAIFDKLKKIKKPLPPEMSSFIAAQILAGLDYAHRKADGTLKPLNIVHRDVSPPNILMSYEGDVKLIDFGIAKAAKKVSKTQAGVLKGKFGYMSPEQIRGMSVDGRSDVFSVGIVLYEMLATRRLFVGETDFQTLEKVRGMEIEAPSNYNPDIPEELDRITLKALERNINKRYQSAVEMQHDLQRFLYSQTPIFTERSLSEWMSETFKQDLEKSKERMNDIEDMDLDGFGIEIDEMEIAEDKSLKKDEDEVQKVDEDEDHDSFEEILEEHSDGSDEDDEGDAEEVEESSDIEDDFAIEPDDTTSFGIEYPSSPVFKTLLLLGILLVAIAAGGWYALDHIHANVINVGNDDGKGCVTFTANWPKTIVSLNGQEICRTPCRVDDFWAGDHSVIFERPGFLPEKTSFSLKPKQVKTINASVFRKGELPAVLMVKSYPLDAEVYVDGKKHDSLTPAVIKGLFAGKEYTVKVLAANFKPVEKKITLKHDETEVHSFDLIPLTPSVMILSEPAGARIILDGRDTKEITPKRISNLKDGKTYRLKLMLAGYRSLKATFTASQKREESLELELESRKTAEPTKAAIKNKSSKFGWLNVFSDPQAKIYIDGRSTDKHSPAMYIRLPIGSHELKLINPEYNIHDISKVSIKAGQTTRINKRFTVE